MSKLWQKIPAYWRTAIEHVLMGGVGGALVAYQAGSSLSAVWGAAIGGAVAVIHALVAKVIGDPNVVSVLP